MTVLAHGLTNNRNELAAFTPFVPGTKVRFDFRGHGRSGAPPPALRFADFARDVDAVASHVGATVAVGTSLGAGAIGNLVCRVPDRFERMVWLLPAGLDVPFPLAGRYRELARSVDGLTPEEMLERYGGGRARNLETPWRFEIERSCGSTTIRAASHARSAASSRTSRSPTGSSFAASRSRR